jgi:hypothetical protein
LLAAGVDPRIVMQIMGWSQVSMLKRYQHVLPAMLDDAAIRLEKVLPKAPAREQVAARLTWTFRDWCRISGSPPALARFPASTVSTAMEKPMRAPG